MIRYRQPKKVWKIATVLGDFVWDGVENLPEYGNIIGAAGGTGSLPIISSSNGGETAQSGNKNELGGLSTLTNGISIQSTLT
jgi:hypothetical protein